jgi:hypothetical protein
VRRSAVPLLLVSLAGVLGGAFLVGTWMVGLAVMADSMLLGLWALFRDDGLEPREPSAPSVHEVTTLDTILERARRAG